MGDHVIDHVIVLNILWLTYFQEGVLLLHSIIYRNAGIMDGITSVHLS